MICREAPYIEPVEAAERLRTSPGFAFLDSAGEDVTLGRYSFIGCAPFGKFAIADGCALWNGARQEGAPLRRFHEILDRYRTASEPG